MRKTIKILILFINLLAAVALVFSYFSTVVPPDKFWFLSLLGLVFPFLVIVNLIFIFFWIFVKPRYVLISFVTLMLGWGFVTRYVQVLGKRTNEKGIKVVSYNVMLFSGDKGSRPKSNADQIISFLDQQNADIICLQEAQLGRNNAFNAANAVKELKSIEHYHYARSSITYGVVTFTRYPIVKMGEIRSKVSQNMAIYTDVLIGLDTIRIFNVHLQSYLIDTRKYEIINSLGIDEEKDIREIREIGSKLKRAFQNRAVQVREIREFIDKTPYAVIVCGDFNDTPVSYAYQKMKGRLKDAFVKSGKGMGRTYIGKLPSNRIDNILYSKHFASYNFKAFDYRMSDHLPVSCTLIMNKD